MIFRDAGLPGVYIVDSKAQRDDRGWFARYFDRDLFAAYGLQSTFDQDSIATNVRAGTIRGLHYQIAPHAETKLIVCVSGAVFDVLVDLRPGPGFGRHTTIELEAGKWQALYVPAGFAHGYQTLADESTLLYRIAGGYAAHAARGIRWDDPELAVSWPLPVTALSERDASWPILGTCEPASIATAPSHAVVASQHNAARRTCRTEMR